jgi:SAM-dependent methyltransferase
MPATQDISTEHETYAKFEDDHWWFVARRNAIAAVLDRIAKHRLTRIVDFGCGTGKNLEALFPWATSRIGVEANSYACRLARQRAAGEIVNCRILDYDPGPGTVDLVTFFDVLYHQQVDVDACLAHAHRILEKGGYVLIFDGAFEFLAGRHNARVHSARRFTKGGLEELLHRAGFQTVQVSYWGVSVFFAMLIKRTVIEAVFPPREEENLDFSMTLNGLLHSVMRAENAIFRRASLPLGASVIALARKPGETLE